MPRILHTTGAETLSATLIATILDPEVALGVVHLQGELAVNPLELAEQLKLNECSKAADAAWRAAGYAGRLSVFEYAGDRTTRVGPHIDQKKGRGYDSPARLAVLSIGREGLARTTATAFGPVLKPGDEPRYQNYLQGMRSQAVGLTPAEMTLSTLHAPSDIVIIPTLPYPTAHAVELLEEPRRTSLYDCLHIIK